MANFGLQQIINESVSDVTATNSVELGTLHWEDGRMYQYVFNAGGTDIEVGLGVALATGSTGYSITQSTNTDGSPCFGVVHNATATSSDYFWVVKQGFVALEASTDVSLVVEDTISMGLDGRHAKVSDTTGVKTPIHGYVAQATASGGSGYGYVNCL